MPASEGVRRIKLVAKAVWVVGLAFVLVAVACEMMLLGGNLPRPLAPLILAVGFLGIYLFSCGFLISIGTWILEGFLLGRTPPG